MDDEKFFKYWAEDTLKQYFISLIRDSAPETIEEKFFKRELLKVKNPVRRKREKK